MRIPSMLALATASLLLAACPQTRPAPGGPGGPGGPPPGPGGDPTPPPGGEMSKAPDGSACTVADDCESGICEGQGCGEGQGVCAARARACTRDLVTYCGCDGQTFQSSGSCPGKRFSARGECGGANGGGGERVNLAVGATCGAGSECASGICEGQGCGPDAGVCVDKKRMCTMDIRQYCGCDGQTFTGSGSCPNRLYAKRGPCDNN